MRKHLYPFLLLGMLLILTAFIGPEEQFMTGSSSPNDPYFSGQWYLQNSHTKVKALWTNYANPLFFTNPGATADNQEIVVAIIDSGFELIHPDLDFWTNPAEVANGIDDDQNGFVDDLNGWNTADNNNDPTFPIFKGGISTNKHGTMVAGVIGAKGNNGQYITGVNQNVKILPIKANTSDLSSVSQAMDYIKGLRILYDQTRHLANPKGAFVVAVNLSHGADSLTPAQYGNICSKLDELGNLGILSVAAASNISVDHDFNDGSNTLDIYVNCTSPYLLTVSSTTQGGSFAPAGFGKQSVDLAAPEGFDLLVPTSDPSAPVFNDIGTSFATPQVTGLVSLLYDLAGSNFMTLYNTDPKKYALYIKEAIIQGANDEFTAVHLKEGTLNASRAARLFTLDNTTITHSGQFSTGSLSTFTLDSAIANTEIFWRSSSQFGGVTGSGTVAQVTALNHSGVGWVEFYGVGEAAPKRKTVTYCAPPVIAPGNDLQVGPSVVNAYETANVSGITSNTAAGATSYEWEIFMPYDDYNNYFTITPQSGLRATIYVKPTAPDNSYMVICRAINSCGEAVHFGSLQVGDPSQGGGGPFGSRAAPFSLNAYPNPVEDDELNLEVTELEGPLASQGSSPYRLRMINREGRIVLESEGRGDHTQQLNLSSLKRGMYIMQVEMNGKTTTKRIWKD